MHKDLIRNHHADTGSSDFGKNGIIFYVFGVHRSVLIDWL